MKKKLGEREAWLLLARAWRKAGHCPCGCGNIVATVGKEQATGICVGIDILHTHGRIVPATEKAMRVRIGRELPYGGFMFPPTMSGARDRVAFCVRQAKQLARKPVARQKKPRAAGKAR